MRKVAIAAFLAALISAQLYAATPQVNVNTATEAQLMLLPGIGPKLANEIYTYAEAGPKLYDPKASANAACDHKCHVTNLSDLDKVKGIGASKLAKLAPYVVFTGATTATEKIKVAKPKAQ